MKIRFVLYVAIAAILVTAAGAVAEARKGHLAAVKTTDGRFDTMLAPLF